jgi:hypothetical protein
VGVVPRVTLLLMVVVEMVKSDMRAAHTERELIDHREEESQRRSAALSEGIEHATGA